MPRNVLPRLLCLRGTRIRNFGSIDSNLAKLCDARTVATLSSLARDESHRVSCEESSSLHFLPESRRT